MMKKYFCNLGGTNQGPVSLEELKQLKITPETLVWHEDLDHWIQAQQLDELTELFELSPPSINKEFKSDNQSEEKSPNLNNVNLNDFNHEKPRMFSRPFSTEGRIRRLEYGISFIIGYFIMLLVNVLLLNKEYSYLVFAYVPIIWFNLAQGAKRCHDLGNSGWYQLIPLYGFWMIFQEGQIEKNRYGTNPKI